MAFKIYNVIGKTCLLNIANKDKNDGTGKYHFIASVAKLMKGQKCPKAFNPPVVLTYENWNEEIFQKLPNFLRELMETTKEFKTLKGLSVVESVEDVPFED